MKIYYNKKLRNKLGQNSKRFVLNKIDLKKTMGNFQKKFLFMPKLNSFNFDITTLLLFLLPLSVIFGNLILNVNIFYNFSILD